jgi:N-acetyl-gamma-glutamyl-phosphate reductase
VTVNSLSGISGAGRSAKESSLFVERSENSVAYNPGRRHRHHPEMAQELALAGSGASLFFTPHLVPMRRGMLSTISFPVKKGNEEWGVKIGEVLSQAYGRQPFIRLCGEAIPATRNVVGSNRCDIGWCVEDSGGEDSMVYLFSVIDNLVKGASGQAVQDFNIRFGFPCTAGLPLRGEV